jgi:hypothetical protein
MPKLKDFKIKDSGDRQNFDSGMVREPSSDKPRFDLIHPLGVPFKKQMLTRFAMHMANGAKKYSDRNWEHANSQKELDRFKESALRHCEQWFCGEEDEDHAAAVFFNITAYEATVDKMADETIKSLMEKLGMSFDQLSKKL